MSRILIVESHEMLLVCQRLAFGSRHNLNFCVSPNTFTTCLVVKSIAQGFTIRKVVDTVKVETSCSCTAKHQSKTSHPKQCLTV